MDTKILDEDAYLVKDRKVWENANQAWHRAYEPALIRMLVLSGESERKLLFGLIRS